MLSKDYKYVAPPTASDDKPDENGVTETMVDFSWDRDIQLSVSFKHFLPDVRGIVAYCIFHYYELGSLTADC